MAEKNAIFGLFTNDKASHVFRDLGKIAKKSAGQTDQLEVAVTKASNRAIKASDAQRQAQAKAEIAQTKYNEAMAKGNVTESQRLAAQERLTVALNRSDAATMENEAAVSALTSAEARATFGAKQLGNAHHFASSKMASLFKTVAAGASALAGYEIFKFGKQSVKAAEDFQVSETKLRTSIKNSGHSWTEYAKPVDDVNTKMAALGFKNSETQDALAVLTTALNDPAKALKYMGTVADLARHQNMSLSDSALLVAKAYEGQLRPLRALGIDAGVAASGVLKIKTAHDHLLKMETRLAQVRAKSGQGRGTSIAHDNAQINAQTHLATLENRYGNSLTRTVAQTTALEKARQRVNKSQATSTTQSSLEINAQAALTDAQQKYNDALHAGEKMLDTVTQRMGGSAAAATNDLKVKQDALNASYEEMQRKVGMKLLPDLGKFTDWMNKSGIPDMVKLGHWVSTNKDNLELLGEGLSVFYVGSKLGLGLKELNLLLKGTALAGGEAAAAGVAVDAAWLPVAGTVGAVALAVAVIDRLTKNLGPDKYKNKLITPVERQAIDGLKGHASNSAAWMNPSVSMSAAPGKAKSLTSISKAPTIIVHQHIAGSVVTEKKLIDTVHNGIAQNMKRAGVSPKYIGK